MKWKSFFWWYGLTWLAWPVGIFVGIVVVGAPEEQWGKLMAQTVRVLGTSPPIWLINLLPFGIYQWVKFLRRSYRSHGTARLLRNIVVTGVLPVTGLVVGFELIQYFQGREDLSFVPDQVVLNPSPQTQDYFAQDGKIRGMHVFGRRPDSNEFAVLTRHHVEWVVFVPYANQPHYRDPQLRFQLGKNGTLSRRDSLMVEQIAVARKQGLRFMLKPHIWLTEKPGGKWRSDIVFEEEAEWEQWGAQYRAFILHYARLAAENGVEAFCVGTELHQTVVHRPAFWIQLIKEIRNTYSGLLVYAANWDKDWQTYPFWEQLDYVGIQAYFPLAPNRNPTPAQLVSAWQPHIQQLSHSAQQLNKPLLFTEIGYKSTPGGARRPWEWGGPLQQGMGKVSTRTQYHAYQAFFEACWDEEWFAGACFWKWNLNHSLSGGNQNRDFTPQRKAAQGALSEGFGR